MALTLIRYKGLSDTRIISKKDLGDNEVYLESGLRWDRENLWKQYVQDPSDELLELLKNEGNFIVEEVSEEDGKTVKQTIVKNDPSRADDTGHKVIQGSPNPTGRTGRGSSTSGA